MRLRTVLRGLGDVPGGGMVVGAALALGALAWLLHKKKLSPEEAKAAADAVVTQAEAVADAVTTVAAGAADALTTESAAQTVATNAVDTANKVSEDAVVAVADANKAEQEAKKASVSGSPAASNLAAEFWRKKYLAIFKVLQAQKAQKAVGKLSTNLTSLRRLSTGESLAQRGFVPPGVDRSPSFAPVSTDAPVPQSMFAPTTTRESVPRRGTIAGVRGYPGGGILGLHN